MVKPRIMGVIVSAGASIALLFMVAQVYRWWPSPFALVGGLALHAFLPTYMAYNIGFTDGEISEIERRY